MSLKVGHHRSASETPLKWRFTGVAIMANVARKPYIFVPPPPSGNVHVILECISYLHIPLTSRLMTVLNYRSWREKTWVGAKPVCSATEVIVAEICM